MTLRGQLGRLLGRTRRTAPTLSVVVPVHDAADYLDVYAVTAYLGPIELGPERYDEITDDAETKRPREVSTEGGTA